VSRAFNIVHSGSGLKVDVIVRKDSPFARTEFLRISGAELELAHVSAWAERLGVADLWDAVQRRASGR
jgi:hypothetical protein